MSLVDGLLGPEEPEVGCDACFAELDHYVELELAGHDPDIQLPGLRAHLAGCQACRRGAREPARPPHRRPRLGGGGWGERRPIQALRVRRSSPMTRRSATGSVPSRRLQWRCTKLATGRRRGGCVQRGQRGQPFGDRGQGGPPLRPDDPAPPARPGPTRAGPGRRAAATGGFDRRCSGPSPPVGHRPADHSSRRRGSSPSASSRSSTVTTASPTRSSPRPPRRQPSRPATQRLSAANSSSAAAIPSGPP